MGKLVDSDELLEWMEQNTQDVFDSGGETVSVYKLKAAIQSGELTPKRVYARAPEGAPAFFTAGKEYEVVAQYGEWEFCIIDDNGYEVLCNWYGPYRWERVDNCPKCGNTGVLPIDMRKNESGGIEFSKSCDCQAGKQKGEK